MTSGNHELTQLAPRIYYLDSRRVNSTNVSGVYLVIGDGITLIETATSLIAPRIIEAAVAIGLEESDIKRAIVTHVHLDHSGGTGWLVNRLPEELVMTRPVARIATHLTKSADGRAIRSNLVFMSPDKPLRRLAIVSAEASVKCRRVQSSTTTRKPA